MKLAYLTEVTALMAAHCQLFVEHADELPSQTIGDYYILSRNRFNRWLKELNDLERGLPGNTDRRLFAAQANCLPVRAVTEEILINEMMARVWTILLLARERKHDSDRIQPIAHNVFLGHLSIRHKALGVLLNDRTVTAGDLSATDRIRRSTERWTDLLCAPLMDQYDLWRYAFHEDTAREFLEDRIDQGCLDHRSRAWVLILAGIRHSFPDEGALAVPVHEEDRRIARLMMNCFPSQAPEMTFWMKSRVREARLA